jgi:hypothetical protein
VKTIYPVWHCVTCGRSVPAAPWAVRDWRDERGGRLCGGCVARLKEAPAGSYVRLGAGWRLVKTDDRTDNAKG